jgi:L-fuculose-phosphate aldolase
MCQGFTIKGVGTVCRDAEDLGPDECTIQIDPALEPALLGLEAGMHLQVLFWMHKLTESDRRTLQGRPMGDRGRPLRGVFALRSPMRPNPIGSTVVRVARLDGCRLVVSGLDALDGSPVIDIKVAQK